jgi:hypothetical protein
VIAAPPLLEGAMKLTVALSFAAVALTPVGAPGTVAGATAGAGVTLFDAPEAALVPALFVAVTLQV